MRLGCCVVALNLEAAAETAAPWWKVLPSDQILLSPKFSCWEYYVKVVVSVYVAFV